MTTWSAQQRVVLDEVAAWLRRGDRPVFYLAGYAGTGKTTLAKHLAEGVNNVLFAAYTGKAASVLRRAGCMGAMTIHQAIYLPSERSKEHLKTLERLRDQMAAELPPEERPRHAELQRLERRIQEERERLKRPSWSLNRAGEAADVDLIVIDECSMVDERVGRDLLSFGKPILVLGDPAQLPPVRGGGFFTSRDPDYMLTEIHRQARNNPIIDLATTVREGRPLLEGEYGDSLVMQGRPSPELVTSADQVIVGANRTRRGVNARMRSLLGRGDEPIPTPGDRLVCLRNHHELGLLNGTTWVTRDAQLVPGMDQIFLTVEDDEGRSVQTAAHTHYFRGEEPAPYEIRDADCFDFGYALTCHKSQGSQWPRVFVFDEGFVFRNDARRWLYTAITRASESVVICRN